MKKFTLLAGIALVAGSAYAQTAQEWATATEWGGLQFSDTIAKTYHYYRISNMRIQRLSYVTSNLYDQYGYEEDNVIGQDNYMMPGIPEYLPDVIPNPDDPATKTPEFFSGDNKFMGLAKSEDERWWIGFSSIPEVLHPDTRFWYFVKGKTPGTVLIENAVIEGSVMRNASTLKDASGANRQNMGFDTKDNQYFVLPVRDLLEEMEFEMELSEEQLDHAFALSTARAVTETSNTALDASNYISRTMVAAQLDEVGDTVYDEDGDVVWNYYGFAGANRTWSPIRENGANNNHETNNGSLWFVEPAATADAEAAIERYSGVIAATYAKAAMNEGTNAYQQVAAQLSAYTNLPGLIKDQTALQAIITRATNPALDASSVNSLATKEAFVEKCAAGAQALLNEAMGLIGHGCIVKFKQQLALRDYPTWEEAATEEDTEKIDTLALGNAWIAAGQMGWFNNSGEMWAGYPAIGPVIESTPGYHENLTQWELVPVWNTPTFKLYNAATSSYIMAWNQDTLAAMTLAAFTAAGKADEIGENARLYTWATTQNEADAAAFQLVACPDAEAQDPLNDDQLAQIEDIELNGIVDPVSTEIIDNVRLVSTDPKTGATTNIHRATTGSLYKFENYGPEQNRWYAQSNVFHIEVVAEGGINEVAAPEASKAQGIYDLQGRRVSKAGKGLYIINGVKTIVR